MKESQWVYTMLVSISLALELPTIECFWVKTMGLYFAWIFLLWVWQQLLWGLVTVIKQLHCYTPPGPIRSQISKGLHSWMDSQSYCDLPYTAMWRFLLTKSSLNLTNNEQIINKVMIMIMNINSCQSFCIWHFESQEKWYTSRTRINIKEQKNKQKSSLTEV